MPKIEIAEAMSRLSGHGGERSMLLLEHGTLQVKVYAPRGSDPQQPHTRDEIYVVMEGRGTFVDGSVRYPFQPGDLIFVPAGVVHRFEDFTDDFSTWVL